MDNPSGILFFNLYEHVTIKNIFSSCCSLAMIVGGIVPYVPQYKEIKKTLNTDGFSLYVCLALLVANTLRIIFWFGHPYEYPLLLQSMVMNLAMLAMVHLCVSVRSQSQIIPTKSHFFADFEAKYFWEWNDFLSYLEFLATFTAGVGILMYFFIEFYVVVELIGFLAVFTEAMLGAPQFYRNLRKKSTIGMSKKMVILWALGDIFKTAYFIVRSAPLQFWICGALQVFIDFLILFQIFLYRVIPSPMQILIKDQQHIS